MPVLQAAGTRTVCLARREGWQGQPESVTADDAAGRDRLAHAAEDLEAYESGVARWPIHLGLVRFCVPTRAAFRYKLLMLDGIKSSPDDPVQFKGLVSQMGEEITSLTYYVEKQKAELHGHRKARFGSKSEGIDKLALDLEDDQEIEAAVDAQHAERDAGDEGEAKPSRPKRKHNRTPLPDHLGRQDEVLSAGEECGDCGGSGPREG